MADAHGQGAQPQQQSTVPRPTDGVNYVCGNCGAEVTIRQGDAVMCRECAVQHRVLYKKRTRNIVQFEAR